MRTVIIVAALLICGAMGGVHLPDGMAEKIVQVIYFAIFLDIVYAVSYIFKK